MTQQLVHGLEPVVEVPRGRLVATRFLLGAVAGYCAWFVLFAGDRSALLVEDGPIETGTVIVFAVAAVIGARASYRSGISAMWLVPGFAILGVLDELSFGARLFGFGLPTIGGQEVDSLHDVFDLADHFVAQIGLSRTAAAGGVLLLCAGLLALRPIRRSATRLASWVWARPPLRLVALSVGLLIAAVLIDQVGSSDATRFVEEMLEFTAAGLVLIASTEIGRSGP